MTDLEFIAAYIRVDRTMGMEFNTEEVERALALELGMTWEEVADRAYRMFQFEE